MNTSPIARVLVSVIVLFFSVCMVSPAVSAVVPCTCSGSPYVIIDTNRNGQPDVPDPSVPGYDQGDPQAFGFDAYWTMEFDNATNQVMVNGHGIFPNKYFGWTNDYIRYQKSSTANSITLTEEEDPHHDPAIYTLVITASKAGDAQNFNKVDFFWKTGMVPYATATMVDSTGDGSYDSVLGESDMQMVPPILFDKPIQFYTHPTTGKNYWLIPEITIRISRTSDPWGPRTCCYKVFVPVGADALEVKCGNEIWGRVTLTGGSPGSQPIPTLNEWGSILFFLLLLAAGIWVMIKTGFGKRFRRV